MLGWCARWIIATPRPQDHTNEGHQHLKLRRLEEAAAGAGVQQAALRNRDRPAVFSFFFLFFPVFTRSHLAACSAKLPSSKEKLCTLHASAKSPESTFSTAPPRRSDLSRARGLNYIIPRPSNV